MSEQNFQAADLGARLRDLQGSNQQNAKNPFADYERQVNQAVGGPPVMPKHEAQAVIDAVSALNVALDRARSQGWAIHVTAQQEFPVEAQVPGPPYCTVRATITREV